MCIRDSNMIILVQSKTVNTRIDSKALADCDSCLVTQACLDIVAQVVVFFLAICNYILFNNFLIVVILVALTKLVLFTQVLFAT